MCPLALRALGCGGFTAGVCDWQLSSGPSSTLRPAQVLAQVVLASSFIHHKQQDWGVIVELGSGSTLPTSAGRSAALTIARRYTATVSETQSSQASHNTSAISNLHVNA
ncbi:uncharacterized protein B0I36DRAFT_434890 [Microdochium trichocladiopsis]|uniref:Uncharacterized protein n=1 Tax=Microdochium trichocladiopsis TaxID=1682393 RepID=A0A9P9BK95_9PEZI|nr:uncharacterized protein B0I36DRAFT_434890 [Microdochium trichocladiopsis]KAH7020951.1 hypothetical protein B0I36DRAFT_434890 [Microdochium trichocladiopsis]